MSSGAQTTDGYRIVDGVHRARAAARLDLAEIEAEIYKNDRLVGKMKVNLDQLRSMKPSIDLSFRWQRALEEVSTGTSAPIKIEATPGGIPIRAVQLKKTIKQTETLIMVQDPKACLYALHHALVAARNAGLAGDAQALLNIVDSTEMIPLWLADETIDRTKDMLQTFERLAARHPQCRLASNVAQGKTQ